MVQLCLPRKEKGQAIRKNACQKGAPADQDHDNAEKSFLKGIVVVDTKGSASAKKGWRWWVRKLQEGYERPIQSN